MRIALSLLSTGASGFVGSSFGIGLSRLSRSASCRQFRSSRPWRDVKGGVIDSSEEWAAALSRNAAWAERTSADDPSFFRTSAELPQAPAFLWIGCSDSRVPETTLLGLRPGDVFAHRNVANVVSGGDAACAAALQYAVAVLGVRHVVVCGHSGCGGVGAVLAAAAKGDDAPLGGALDLHLHSLRQLHRALAPRLPPTLADKVDLLVRENVRRGVAVVRRDRHVIAAVRDRGLRVHGVVYHLATGKLEEVDCTVAETEEQREAAGMA